MRPGKIIAVVFSIAQANVSVTSQRTRGANLLLFSYLEPKRPEQSYAGQWSTQDTQPFQLEGYCYWDCGLYMASAHGLCMLQKTCPEKPTPSQPDYAKVAKPDSKWSSRFDRGKHIEFLKHVVYCNTYGLHLNVFPLAISELMQSNPVQPGQITPDD